MGVHRIHTIRLAEKMNLKPYNIPRILYQIQCQGQAGISYDTDHESFILEVSSIPTQSQAMPLAERMHLETRKIENSLV
jgi:hypothetical protein